MKAYSGLIYSQPEGHMPLCLDIHLPPEGRIAKKTYVYFHGGGLVTGTRDDENTSELCNTLSARGIAVISADYRLYPQAAFPNYIRDAAKAVRWVFDHLAEYSLPKTVYIGGSSAGSYLSMMLCFAREYLREVGLVPEDAAGYLLDAGQPTSHFEVLSRKGIDPRRIVVDEAAPFFYITDACPARPLMLICAENDIPGRMEQNMLLARTLEFLGYNKALLSFHVMDGCEHCGYLNPENAQAHSVYIELCATFLHGGE